MDRDVEKSKESGERTLSPGECNAVFAGAQYRTTVRHAGRAVDIAHDSLKEWQAHNGIARNGPPRAKAGHGVIAKPIMKTILRELPNKAGPFWDMSYLEGRFAA